MSPCGPVKLTRKITQHTTSSLCYFQSTVFYHLAYCYPIYGTAWKGPQFYPFLCLCPLPCVSEILPSRGESVSLAFELWLRLGPGLTNATKQKHLCATSDLGSQRPCFCLLGMQSCHVRHSGWPAGGWEDTRIKNKPPRPRLHKLKRAEQGPDQQTPPHSSQETPAGIQQRPEGPFSLVHSKLATCIVLR